jgi:hypothetical protein
LARARLLNGGRLECGLSGEGFVVVFFIVSLLPVLLFGAWLVGALLLSVLERRCPGCRRYKLKQTMLVLSNPGRGGAYYACEKCLRQFHWSHDERAWHDVTTGKGRRGSAAADH